MCLNIVGEPLVRPEIEQSYGLLICSVLSLQDCEMKGSNGREQTEV